MTDLTEKQEAFCEHYLTSLNATQASIDAGYSKKTAYSQGGRLLKNVEVQDRIRVLKAARSVRVGIKNDDILRGILEEIEASKLERNSTSILKGWEMLARHNGMFTEKIAVESFDQMEIFEKARERLNAHRQSMLDS